MRLTFLPSFAGAQRLKSASRRHTNSSWSLPLLPKPLPAQSLAFRVVDKTKPGHRKTVALFLLEPTKPRLSTTDIPPQQADWSETAMHQAPSTSLLSKLPAELVRKTARHLPNLMTLEEAKAYRMKLMDERTSFVEEQDDNYFATEFNFCEH
ncbi:hypothetical protein FRB90_003261 [Tulasnella sp. 427]|nr:hypothetical protein FRB90_003261 [Tulasnella sp. 427]